MLGSDPLEEPTWLLRSAVDPSSEEQPNTELVGMSPDASIVYLAYEGRLLLRTRRARVGSLRVPERDAERGRRATRRQRTGERRDASLDTTTGEGKRPGENNPASFDNQLSEDGKRVLFVSSGELYVHEIEADGSEHSVLVSASQLPGHVGEAAPDGVALFENLTKNAESSTTKSAPTYAYAWPDGSHVFFQSSDRLTSMAPGGTESKVYDFDVDSGALEYLPGVTLGGSSRPRIPAHRSRS